MNVSRYSQGTTYRAMAELNVRWRQLWRLVGRDLMRVASERRGYAHEYVYLIGDGLVKWSQGKGWHQGRGRHES